MRYPTFCEACDDLARFEIFRILTENFGGDTAHDKGRPGMDLWSIFVLAVLRTSCNIDYDKLKDLADNHITLRGFLGIPVSDFSVQFARSTLGENLSKLTPEILDQINVEVVKAGHCFLDEEGESTTLECRVDSFVVETDVEYPTDTGLFADSLRKMVEILGRAQMPGWRQWQYHLQQVHIAKRRAQKARSSRSRDPAQREKGEQRVRDAYQDFIHTAGLILLKVDENTAVPNDCDTDRVLSRPRHGSGITD